MKTGAPIYVREVMTPNPTCARESTSARELAELLEWDEISGVPVVDSQDRLVGVVSQTDLIRHLLEGPPGRQPDRALAEVLDGFSETGADWSAHSLGNVEDLMSTEPITARPEELVSTVARRMAEEEVHRIVVVDGDSRPMGIITTLDLLAVFPE